ncbi:hypothetical protein HDU98_005858 [Podochytrium sp. JEL0797]|nr:hypothetical protein HDU98_005858 [Podochytrium sp. JEL0797]
MGGSVSVTPARFNTSDGLAGFEETSIVTSTGRFKLNDYTIKEYTNDMVADNFKIGSDGTIVALPESLHIVKSAELQKPAKSLKSRSSIVDSPF